MLNMSYDVNFLLNNIEMIVYVIEECISDFNRSIVCHQLIFFIFMVYYKLNGGEEYELY